MSFDQIGLCHGFQLRPGNTKSGVDAESLLRQSFLDGKLQIDRKFRGEDFFRGDSAYCKQDMIKACLELGVLFTLTAHDGITGWKSELEKVSGSLSWIPWQYTDEQIKKSVEKGFELPRIELAKMNWTPAWSEKQDSKLVFSIVIKRTWNTEREKEKTERGRQAALFYGDGVKHEDPWDYYAVVTNFSLNLSTPNEFPLPVVEKEKVQKKYYSIQEVFEFHQKRGNAENFIREEKYGYDLKHFPCLSLRANHAYGLLAMVSHNILRWIAIMTRPDKPHFSKKLRKHFVFIPAKIVHHARQVFMKMMDHHFKEVMKIREAFGLQPEKVPEPMSTA